jgi:hypothetical protein
MMIFHTKGQGGFLPLIPGCFGMILKTYVG